jgi:hypothetical protein
MRLARSVVGAGALVGLLTLSADPASAHSCAVPVTVEQGSDVPVEIAVTAGGEPSNEVTFWFEGPFEVVEVADVRGWVAEVDGASVRFTGGELAPEACVPFEMVVRGEEAGTFRVRAVQRLADGRTFEHPTEGDIFLDEQGQSVVVDRSGPPNPAFEQVVYVTEASGGSSARTVLLIGTALGGVIVLAVAVARTRRRS